MNSIKQSANFLIKGKHGRPVVADVTRPENEGRYPVVVFSHGFKGFKDWGPFNLIASHFASHGFVFLKINFAFNGTTPETPYDFADLEAFGSNNFTRELDDLDVTIDWVIENSDKLSVDSGNISLIGHSRGGGISILKGYEDDRVKRIAGWAPVAGFDRHVSKKEILQWKKSGVLHIENTRTNQMMPLYIQLYHDFIENHRRLNIQNAIRLINKPVLLAHASDDDTIPVQQVRALGDLNPLNVRFLHLAAGGHTFETAHPFIGNTLPESFQKVVNETIDFLKAPL